MPLQNAVPYRVNPRGVSDSLDGSNVRPGSMTALVNLVFDPSTPFCLQPRPAAVVKSSFPGFATPGVVSAAMIIGTRVYGMIETARTVGYDEPFVYDIPSDTFIAVGGVIDATTCPLTPSTTGAWTPPAMEANGIYVIVTHPGFPGGAGAFFGWFDITNPAAPTWNAGNTTVNVLPGVPSAVIQFNSRLYFAVSNKLWYTDALTLVMTGASQSLTIGHGTSITALAPLSLSTTAQGVLQAVLVFKSNNISQITGDAASGTLAVNDLPEAVGCSSPRSITSTPSGVFFVAVDGLRRVGLDGLITQPDEDIRVPFINAATPSRVSGAFNAGVYRCRVINNAALGAPYQEWWFDTIRKGWTGPHSLRQDLVKAYSNTFILFDSSNPGKLYQSDAVVSATTGYVENSATLDFLYQTQPMPDRGDLKANSTLVSTINAIIPSGAGNLSFAGSTESGEVLSTAILYPTMTATTWGVFIWGAALWQGNPSGLRPYTIPWTNALVFTKLTVQITGQCSTGIKLSNFQTIYQPLGYIPL